MDFYKQYENNNETGEEEKEEAEINKIESEILEIANNAREEIKTIKLKVKKLSNFQEAEDLNAKIFVESFKSDIKEIENSFNFLLEYKNKFIDLYNKKYGDYPESSIDNEKNNNLNDQKNKKADLLEIKEEIEKARIDILKVFPDLTRSLNALGDGKDLQKIFIETNINEIELVEENIEKLSHCKEIISEFCE